MCTLEQASEFKIVLWPQFVDYSQVSWRLTLFEAKMYFFYAVNDVCFQTGSVNSGSCVSQRSRTERGPTSTGTSWVTPDRGMSSSQPRTSGAAQSSDTRCTCSAPSPTNGTWWTTRPFSGPFPVSSTRSRYRFVVYRGKTTAHSCTKFCMIIFSFFTYYVQVVICFLLRSGHQVKLNDLISHHFFCNFETWQCQSRRPCALKIARYNFNQYNAYSGDERASERLSPARAELRGWVCFQLTCTAPY